MLTWVAIALFAAALILLLMHRRYRARGGLPSGELVYSDTGAQDVPVLISKRYGLKGKPDALVRIPSGDLIPVERKKSRAPKRPYEGDLIQATAYCVLVEENYGRTPPFMRIQYADACFDEPYTAERKQWVLRTCEQIRQARRCGIAHRSHTMPGKCRACGQRLNCDQGL
jgi:CRISPR/Cas system-associated exonuclease Cas4 (RecB family)